MDIKKAHIGLKIGSLFSSSKVFVGDPKLYFYASMSILIRKKYYSFGGNKKKMVSGAGGLAALANKGLHPPHWYLTLTSHVMIFKKN